MGPWGAHEIAQLYGVSPATVQGWLKRGLLKGRKNDEGRWEVPMKALVLFRPPLRGRPPRPDKPDEPHYSLIELAKRYRVAPRTVWRWIKAGKLAAFQIVPSGRWFVRPDKLQEFEEDEGWPTPLPSQYLGYEPTTPEGED